MLKFGWLPLVFIAISVAGLVVIAVMTISYLTTPALVINPCAAIHDCVQVL